MRVTPGMMWIRSAAAALASLIIGGEAVRGERIAAPQGAAPCADDRNRNGTDGIGEVLTCVAAALGGAATGAADACDTNRDAVVTVDEVVAVVDRVLHGCATPPSPTPTPTATVASPATSGPAPAESATPTPRMGLGCGGANEKPCLPRGAGALPTCVVDESLPIGRFGRTTIGAEDRIGGLNCSTKGGGTGAPERVYEFVAPFAGAFEIAVESLGQAFQPLLHARRGDCRGQFLACSAGNPLTPAAITVPPEPGAQLAAGERIAIVVDGNGLVPGSNPPRVQQGNFALTIRPLLPDLAVRNLRVPARTVVGAPAIVEVDVANEGDVAVDESFTVQVQYSRDAALAEPLGTPASCRIAGLARDEVAPCRFDVPLAAPFVAAGSYFIGVAVDPDGLVQEVGETGGAPAGNNFDSAPTAIDAPGALLDQQVFRAADGTTYQVVRVLPSADETLAERYRITSVAGAVSGLRACAAADGYPGGAATAIAAAPDILAPGGRSDLLEPDGTAIEFDPRGSGALALGRGEAVTFSSTFDAGGRLPQACVVTDELPGCDGAATLRTVAFGLELSGVISLGLGPLCRNGAQASFASAICREEPEDGFALEPGQSVVFVYGAGFNPIDFTATGLESIDVGLAGYGINLDEDSLPGCTAHQVVEARALVSNAGRQPLLTFVESLGKRRRELTAIVAAGDGRHLYAGDASGQIVRLDRTPGSGALATAQLIEEGSGGVSGLNGVSALTLSPDERYLYAASGCARECRGASASATDDALVVFARDLDTGELRFVQTLRDGIGRVDGLAGASAVAASPDGLHVYVTGTLDDAVAVFSRLASGRLRFERAVRAPSGVLQAGDLDGPQSIAISANGANVYVGAPREAANRGHLLVFSRNAASGALTPLQVLAPNFRPYALAVGPGDAQVYVASGRVLSADAADLNENGIWIYTRSAQQGTLSLSTVVGSIPGEFPAVRGLALRADGGTLELLLFSGGHAAVATYSRSQAGDLAFVGMVSTLVTARAPVLALVPDGSHAYVSGFFGDSVSTVTLGRDPLGALSLGTTFLVEDPGPVDLANPLAVAASRDGRTVFVGTTGRLVNLDRDADSGRLTIRQVLAGACHPFAITSDDQWLYCLDSSGLRLATYRRDLASRQLQFGGFTNVVGSSGTLDLSPDDRHLYIANRGGLFSGGSIEAFSRDPDTGVLTGAPSASWTPALGGQPALRVDPSGQDVYVASGAKVDRFARAADGRLTLAQTVTNLPGSSLSPGGHGSMAISTDGPDRSLYVARGNASGAGRIDAYSTRLVVRPFAAAPPRLEPRGIESIVQLVESEVNGLGGQRSYFGSAAVVVGRDDNHVFATRDARAASSAPPDDALVAFSRSRTSGGIAFLELQRNGVGRVQGIAAPRGLAVSPDGKNLYAIGDDAVVTFAINR